MGAELSKFADKAAALPTNCLEQADVVARHLGGTQGRHLMLYSKACIALLNYVRTNKPRKAEIALPLVQKVVEHGSKCHRSRADIRRIMNTPALNALVNCHNLLIASRIDAARTAVKEMKQFAGTAGLTSMAPRVINQLRASVPPSAIAYSECMSKSGNAAEINAHTHFVQWAQSVRDASDKTVTMQEALGIADKLVSVYAKLGRVPVTPSNATCKDAFANHHIETFKTAMGMWELFASVLAYRVKMAHF